MYRLARNLLFLLLLGNVHHLAQAQILSVYGMFTPTHASHVQTGSTYNGSAGGSYTNQYTSFWAAGVGGGVTLNFANLHLIKLGLDARGSTKPGTTGADTAELGLRLGIQPPLLRIKPYVQGSVGYLGTRTANVSTNSSGTGTVGGTFENRYATVVVRGGVDVPIFPFVDFRVIEAGGGHAWNTGLSGSNANVFSLGTGLVVHF